ncbi:30S ribosomal protein S12 methylthiotransferase RimO [Dethiothermospora halolimnae]|uniref:30S ribosomal protein S12 methylthiotransferase RimO n=1 Tax=Dethiothermospora halolimnae TaxID=3114390 RepID=UPI003CCBA5F9
MSYNIAMVSLGCSKNLIDSEIMLGILKKHQFNLTEEMDEADIIVINTCGFIDAAKEESINTIVELGQYKEHGKCKVLIVCGCLGERYKQELLDELPEVDAIIGTGNIKEIPEIINETLKGNRLIRTGKVDIEYDDDLTRLPLSKSATAYIKIAEGCDNYCTYCIIPKLRGKYRSRKIESIIDEASRLADQGVKELILIAQDTSRYGIDLYDKFMLPKLLDELNKIEKLKWIRILYLYPDAFDQNLIDSIKRNNKVVKYVDMPIQHINNTVLKRMNRNTSKEMIKELILKIRKEIPNIIIRTTVIVGFPGETDDQFNELYDFAKEIKFDRLGAFTYSKEEGTAAAKLEDQIDEEIKSNRQSKIMELQRTISYEKNKDKIGSDFEVIIEEKIENEKVYIGRTYMDSPEIDGIVYIDSDKNLEIGSFQKVLIKDCLEYDLMGEIENESSK